MNINERAANALWNEKDGSKTVADLRKEILDAEPTLVSLVDHIASEKRFQWAYLQYDTNVYRARVSISQRSEYDRKGGPGIGVLELEAAVGFYPRVNSRDFQRLLGHNKFFDLLNRPEWIQEQLAP